VEGAGKCGEKPVADRADLDAAMPLQHRPDRDIVVREQVAPGAVAHTSDQLRGPDDVHEQDRREVAIKDLLYRRAEVAPPDRVDRRPRLVADDPGVVTRRDLECIKRLDDEARPIVELDL
jgi:hypothetical protein